MTYAAFHPQVGYAQGMNDIAGRFLVVFDSEVCSLLSPLLFSDFLAISELPGHFKMAYKLHIKYSCNFVYMLGNIEVDVLASKWPVLFWNF